MIQKTYFKTKDYCKVTFSFSVGNAERMEILGLNSDWENAILMGKTKDGSFRVEVSLPKNSQHEFKYLVNASEWVNDPTADGEQPNAFGGSNSILSLQEPAAAAPVKKTKTAAPAKTTPAKKAKEVKPVKKAKKTGK